MDAILQLIRDLEAEPERADGILGEFVSTRVFPMVEGETATFFYWDRGGADEVQLLHWVFGLESRQSFLRLGSTSAFYLPLDLPFDGRVEYKLLVRKDGGDSLRRDPLNPRRAHDPFGSNSVLPMPGYRVPPWTRAQLGIRAGTVENVDVDSAVWRGRRWLRLYRPAEYKSHKSYPLLVVHDGDDYLRFAAFKQVLDNLIHRHEVEPLLVAFTSGGPDRNGAYAANPHQVQFIVDELVPAVEAVANVSENRRDRAVMGASFGAVTSLYTAWQRPEAFGKLLLQSGSFAFTDVGHHGRGPMWDPIVTFVNAFRRDPARIDAQLYISCGTFESLIRYNRGLVPLLRSAGLQVQFVESRDGHNWIAWRDRLREGLTYLFPGHLRMYYE